MVEFFSKNAPVPAWQSSPDCVHVSVQNISGPQYSGSRMRQGWQIHNLRSWLNRCRYLSTGPVPTAAVNNCLRARLYAARHCPSNMHPPSCSRSRGSRCHWVHVGFYNLKGKLEQDRCGPGGYMWLLLSVGSDTVYIHIYLQV